MGKTAGHTAKMWKQKQKKLHNSSKTTIYNDVCIWLYKVVGQEIAASFKQNKFEKTITKTWCIQSKYFSSTPVHLYHLDKLSYSFLKN